MAHLLISSVVACHKTDAEVTEILRAAGNGDLAKTRLLLNHNPNLAFSKNSQGFTALHYAASYGYTEIAELLLSQNADVNAKTSKGDAPLHYAASYGHKDIVQLLLLNKAMIDVRDGVGCTPLYDAATNGQIEEVGILLANKADVNAGTLRGYTPLSGAASHGRGDVARLLIDNGANVSSLHVEPHTANSVQQDQGRSPDINPGFYANKSTVANGDFAQNPARACASRLSPVETQLPYDTSVSTEKIL